jgi:dolichyl-phosphate-mannose-protein mannosyltransferase
MIGTRVRNCSDVLQKTIVPALLLICLLYGSLVNRHWQPEWDSAFYIELSRSMISGQGFSYLGHPETKFPPVFPLVLSPIMLLFGKNYLLMNFLMILFAATSIWLTYRLFSAFFSREYSALIAIMTSLSWFVVDQSTFIMTDVPYMTLSLASLLLMNGRVISQGSILRFLLLPVVILTACFVRTVGLSLIMTFLVFLFLSRKALSFQRANNPLLFRTALTLLIVLTPIVMWQVRSSRVAMDKSSPLASIDEFTDYSKLLMRSDPYDPESPRLDARLLLLRAVKNVTYYAAQADCIALGLRIDTSVDALRTHSKLVLALLGVVSLIIVAGFVRSFVRHRRVFDIYVIFYLGIFIVWPAREPRFLVPILPFILHYCWSGSRWVLHRALPMDRKLLLTGVVGACFVSYFVLANLIIDARIVAAQRRQPFYQNDSPSSIRAIESFFNVVDWVQANTPPDVRVSSVMAPWVVLRTGRWCVTYPWVENQMAILSFFQKVGINYLIVAPSWRNKDRLATALIDAYPMLFTEVVRDGEARVYKIDKESLNGILGGCKWNCVNGFGKRRMRTHGNRHCASSEALRPVGPWGQATVSVSVLPLFSGSSG